jgi:hypothetical protein
MSVSVLRSAICWALIAVVPVSVMATDTADAAMLYSNGATSLNGNLVPNSSAIFPGDVIETQPTSVANINAPGSSVMVFSESVVKFQNNSVCVEHGMVRVATSTQMAAFAGGLTITPAATSWTQFEVKDVDGTVQIAARKGDLSVKGAKKTSTITEGQQAALEGRDTEDGCGKKPGAAPRAANGGIFSSSPALWGAIAAGGGILAWVLVQGDEPMSSDQRTCSRTKC